MFFQKGVNVTQKILQMAQIFDLMHEIVDIAKLSPSDKANYLKNLCKI